MRQQLPPGYPAGYGDPGTNDVFTAAQEAMERGDMDSAAAAFEKVLAASPGDPVATMGLGQVNLIRRVEGYDQATARRDADEQPGDAAAQAKVADIDLAMGRIEASFDRLLDTIRRTSGEEREKARQHLVGLFAIFPPRDPTGGEGQDQAVQLAVLAAAGWADLVPGWSSFADRGLSAPWSGLPGPLRRVCGNPGELLQGRHGGVERGELVGWQGAQDVREQAGGLGADALQYVVPGRRDGDQERARVVRSRLPQQVTAVFQHVHQPGEGRRRDPLRCGQVS